jgi:hypothetical protein
MGGDAKGTLLKMSTPLTSVPFTLPSDVITWRGRDKTIDGQSKHPTVRSSSVGFMLLMKTNNKQMTDHIS